MKKLFCSLFVLMAGLAPLIAQEDREGCKPQSLR